MASPPSLKPWENDKLTGLNRMKDQNRDCWVIEKWKKLWIEEIITLEVYIPNVQNLFFGQWVTGWRDYLDSGLHPCLPISPTWKVTIRLLCSCSHLEWFIVQAQVISQMEFILQWAPGCRPDQRTYYRTMALQPLSTDSHHHRLFLIKKWIYN